MGRLDRVIFVGSNYSLTGEALPRCVDTMGLGVKPQ